MAKRKIKITKPLTKRQRVLRTMARQKGSTARRKVIQHKLKIYNHLLKDFTDKQIQLGKYKRGEKGLRNKAASSEQMKNLLKDIKSPDPFRKLRALKQTTRRDGIPDFIAVGESAHFTTAEAV